MYRPTQEEPPSPSEFKLPFEGKLSPDNRWVILAELIPWLEFEAEYATLFSVEMGSPAKSFRMALGALIIKEKLEISSARNGRTNQRKPIFAVFHRSWGV
ncbi:hypothetical protein E5S67_04994 [Microcoleus sp. IPMA8]|uniref:Transposase InsH N-terminal domain-containing protein n=1 Tax=Microcoleus asticus IPMA8 TaxID=2563858 RepID=A0ABX2D3K4_9CYAN|nr:hypothetical protein [Microcoleus asticus IPMA8]